MNYTYQFLHSIEACAAEGINSINYVRTLLHCHLRHGVTPTWMAAELRISTAAMTGLVDTLVKLGMIERVRVPIDRRIYHLVLTGKGREFITKLMP